MNQTMGLLLNRKSVRVYEGKEVSKEVKEKIIAATLRAPTAGTMMLICGARLRASRVSVRL